MSPRPIVTGSISRSTCRTARVAHVERELEPEVQPPQDRYRMRNWTIVPTSTPSA